MTAAMVAVLLGLGTWQVHRLAWKEGILAQIDRAEGADPIPLPAEPSPFTKVAVTGEFLFGEESLYGADVRDTAKGPEMGARTIVPLKETNGRILLVDRGWVPLSRSEPIERPAGEVTVSGYVRFGDTAHWFSAKDDVAARRFFTLDTRTIGAAVGHPDVPPFVLVVLAPASAADLAADRWPDPARHLPRPPNNHLSYIVTWYGLAVALLAIFAVWVRKELRA
jgi:surfeit locus 1 family protein